MKTMHYISHITYLNSRKFCYKLRPLTYSYRAAKLIQHQARSLAELGHYWNNISYFHHVLSGGGSDFHEGPAD